MHVTLITAHPLSDSFTRALAEAWAHGARRAGATVDHFDATELAFDPVLRAAYRERLPDEPDLARVRGSIARAAHVTWIFPTWWAGLPAALKGLVDRLFLPHESFVYRGGLPRGLLAGRSSRWVATMDSPRLWYWLRHHGALQGSFGNGTLRFVGFGPVRRTMVYGARRLSERGRAAWLEALTELGAADVEQARRRARRASPTESTTAGRAPSDRRRSPLGVSRAKASGAGPTGGATDTAEAGDLSTASESATSAP